LPFIPNLLKSYKWYKALVLSKLVSLISPVTGSIAVPGNAIWPLSLTCVGTGEFTIGNGGNN
jgi:hypothetical protein